ncbi:MAG: hypothetical protein L0H36_00410 [bacterium]|nr:hypothetical protein [bacterium]MDN5835079.1 hypothetical protein [bacterium]
MDNQIYTPQEAKETEKKSMYLTIGTWTLVIIAVAFMFTTVMMVKSQLAENKQAIYENSKRILELQDCVDNGIKPCTPEAREND